MKHRFSLRFCLVFVWLACALIACGPRQTGTEVDTAARGYVLPALEIPDGALLLYEQVGTGDGEGNANWRYYIDVRGCYYSAREADLDVPEPAQIEGGVPVPSWNAPFSSMPDDCLTEGQFAELTGAIADTGFADMQPSYTSVAFPYLTSPYVERWTWSGEGGLYTVVVEQGAAPLRLIDLQAVVGRLVGEASRPVSP